MNILLTNDDGYNSIGIVKLKEKLSKYGRVVIVAPLNPMSAKSCSITIGSPVDLIDMGNDVFALTGTPADCVSFALSNLDIEFDLVVSGCNNGLNICYDTLYSGTIGAALEALTFRKPAIAVSCEVNMFGQLDFFDDVYEFIQKHNLLSNEYVLNVNFPINEIKEIKLGTLYYRKKIHYYVKKDDGYYAFRKTDGDYEKYPDCDNYQVNHHIVSIVPLNKTYFSKELYERLKKNDNHF